MKLNAHPNLPRRALRWPLLALVMWPLSACATAGHPGIVVEDAEEIMEENEADCTLQEAGHFYIKLTGIPQYDIVEEANRRIRALGFDEVRNRRFVQSLQVGSNGVHQTVIEAVEGDGYRYGDGRCRFKRAGKDSGGP